MKKARLLALAAALAAAPAAGQIERSQTGSHGGVSHGGGARSGRGPISPSGGATAQPSAPAARPYSPPVIIKQRRVQVPAQQPRAFERPEHVVREPRPVPMPSRDDSGRPITQMRRAPPSRDAAVVRDQRVVNEVTRLQRVEVVPNQAIWHRTHGTRFCHFFDGRVHWWGFFDGPTFFWSRFWYDRWWWYDPVFARWVFWWDGFWWWPGPGGAFYVYVDNTYYPYEAGEVYVKQPEVEAPPQSVPATPTQGATYDSPDGKRQVQVYGERSEAFLYDKTPGAPVFLAYLGGSVKNVRFSGGAAGKPLRILLDFDDGSFALFDKDGKTLDEKSPAAKKAAALPATPPPNVPPPPE